MSETRKERRRQENVDEIFAVALQLFVQQGFRGTSMHQIAAKTEFSVGKLYTFFPSKEDLFRGLQERGMAEFRTIFEAVIDDGGRPLDELHTVLRSAFAFASTKRDIIRVEIAEHLGRALNVDRPIHDLVRDRVRKHLERAVGNGDLRPLDTYLLATMILGAGEALVENLAGAEGDDPYAAIPDRIMELMVLPHVRKNEVPR
jgi:AcrR family transcriptional regulator